ncbi:MAG: ribonuclease HII [Nitrospirota bacterium]
MDLISDEEIDRLENLSSFEREAYNAGYNLIAGVDEAGRGPLAGPVVASAVILPKGIYIPSIDDSKKLSEKKREQLYEVISKEAISIGIGIVDEKTIDEINILQAAIKAMKIAIGGLSQKPDFILTDAVSLPGINIPHKPIIKGDSKSISIAAASIIAKVTRDRLMYEYHKKYPAYNFISNKGYGTAKHLEMLRKHGPCEIHRRTFKGVV